MIEFNDVRGNRVRLKFNKNAFSSPPQHALVICSFKNSWLLTKHKKRGIEFPGGKAEKGETIEETALREVFEETGAVLKAFCYIGEYEVREGEDSFVKAIFYGEVEEFQKKQSYLETEGPVLIEGDILTLRHNPEYSFIMKDMVVEKSIFYIREVLKEGLLNGCHATLKKNHNKVRTRF